MREALLYGKEKDGTVRCNLCAHRCHIRKGQHGFCAVRENVDGTLYTHTYENLVVAHSDPIEKKPLYHVYPGSQSYSIATAGCNFRCSFCQNWHISQASVNNPDDRSVRVTAKEIVREALRQACLTIACTYTEPTIFFEYAYDIAREAHAQGIATIFVTNGYMTPEAIDMIHPYLTACNVDLKAYSDTFYKKLCKAKLQPVLDSITYMKKLGIWVEVTTLVIPDKNDSEEELHNIARFIAGIGTDIPWHISRFRPEYEYTDSYQTPMETLERAYEIGKTAGLKYVYLGNVLEGNTTFCHACGAVLIERQWLSASLKGIKGNACRHCEAVVSGIF